jgi:acyl-CoA reductase-like NAD-dependent aldehyde dehydrogenase
MNFVAGQWREGAAGRTYELRNPFDSADVVGEFPASDARDVDDAVEAAQDAARSWSRLPAPQRGSILFRAAEIVAARSGAIAADMTREMGKPLREARVEAARGADTLRFCAGEAWRSQGEIFSHSATGNPIQVLRRPLGVVGLICPWNFPFSIPLWKAAPALVHGNCVVLKVAHEAPGAGLHLAACLEAAGVPKGVFNVVVGRGQDVGPPLIGHPSVRAISFTGSSAVGEGIRDDATKLGKRVQLELGGHSPLVVLDDADLPRAAEAAYAGAFWSAGQKCTATRRIYVHDGVYDSFKTLFIARIERGVVGDPADPDTEVGPLISEHQMDVVLSAIERGQSEGAVRLLGGERLDDDAYLVSPTLFEGVDDTAFLSQEEVFGPVTSLYRVAHLDEAIERSNSTRFGLSASIFTRDAAAIQRFAREVQAGIVRVNAATAGGEPHVPFGGTKASGYGPREQGRAAIDFYTETVTVYTGT